MEVELALDGSVVCDRIRAVERLQLQNVHEQPRALEVGEEFVAEARAGARSLDQTRDIGDYQLPVITIQGSEDRLQSSERIVRHFGMGARKAAQKRRLARVREADEADIGEQLELERDPPLVSRYPALGEPRRLSCCRGEVLVAAATEPPRATTTRCPGATRS